MRHDEFLADRYAGKRVALIGGSGQVGHFLFDVLSKHGATVEVHDAKLRGESFDVSQHHLYDIIGEAGRLRRNLEWWKPDYVFNLAAKVSGVTYNEKSHFDMGLQNVLLQALPMWVCENLDTRFVQFSTVCVLPHDSPVPTSEIPVAELGLPEPSNLGYGLAKQFGEWLCHFATTEKTNLNALCLRPSNLYGRERPDDPVGHVIPRFTWRLMHREDPMAIRGLPTTERSFLHASDCAEAAALLAATSYCGTVNVPACGSVSIEKLLVIVASHVGWMPRSVTWGTEKEQGYAKREADRTLFDRIFVDNGLPMWMPKIEFQSGIGEYVQWCRRNFAKEAA